MRSRRPRPLLVLDGTGELRELLRRALDGFTLHFAHGRREAAQWLAAHPEGRVLLVDPGPRGLAAPAAAARRPGLVQILFSEDRSLVRALHGRSLGTVHRVLPRDCSPETLREAVLSAWVQGEPARIPIAEGGAADRPGARLEVRDVEGGWRDKSAGSRALRFQEDWVKVVAHDVRSPLSLINSYAQLLLDDPSGLDAAARPLVERIHRAGLWTIDLLDNILDQAMLGEATLTLKCAPHRLADILAAAVESARGLAEAERVALAWEPPRERGRFHLDRLKIEQILHNLVTNGIKFSRPGDRVVVSCRASKEGIEFRVADTGPGLPPGLAEQVFERFFSFPPDPRAGRGLGLAIARFLVELHGGRIWVESRPGEGTRFSFTIRAQGPQGHRPGPRSPGRGATPPRQAGGARSAARRRS